MLDIPQINKGGYVMSCFRDTLSKFIKFQEFEEATWATFSVLLTYIFHLVD